MEIFVDGGLFELLIAAVLGYMINYIFLKKYLLILFSVISVAAPVLLLFTGKGDLFYFLIALTLINSILLVILLWTERKRHPFEPLFKIERPKKIVSKFFKKKSFKKEI